MPSATENEEITLVIDKWWDAPCLCFFFLMLNCCIFTLKGSPVGCRNHFECGLHS